MPVVIAVVPSSYYIILLLIVGSMSPDVQSDDREGISSIVGEPTTHPSGDIAATINSSLTPDRMMIWANGQEDDEGIGSPRLEDALIEPHQRETIGSKFPGLCSEKQN
mmetsp:Transcript_8907/g.16710  ORF Transcript_8907/g.16710 Transcript_8907/m.16710 type:complete len:108 (+) Transcript_8907:58-381(+)